MLKIYFAAFAGYATHQEFLKLMNDDSIYNEIDVHISYFGANEINASYIPWYSQKIFNSVANVPKSFILPNTIEYINKVIFKKVDLNVAASDSNLNPAKQTTKNLLMMKELSELYHYKFIPIFQPVLGAGFHTNDYDRFKLQNLNIDTAHLNNIYNFSKAMNHFDSEFFEINQTSKLGFYDFTDIFKDLNDYPFIDDCHLKGEYEHIISDSIFSILSPYFNHKL